MDTRTVACAVCGAVEERVVLEEKISGETKILRLSQCQNCAKSSTSPSTLIERMRGIVRELEYLGKMSEVHPTILRGKNIRETTRRFKRSLDHLENRVARLNVIKESLHAKRYAKDDINGDDSIPVGLDPTGS